ncbi:MAG: hypothetical protein IKT69_03325, partial [Bacteroidales bacterium]|nr:hypothetical protein [Bacteroidales bacterium]
MYIYLSMITFKASRLPRTASRIKDASLACPILICPFIKFIQGALFKNNSEHAPSDSKKQNAHFLSARAAVLRSGSVQRVRAEVLCRGSVQRFRAATHHFKKKNLYRDSRIQEKQWHNAATHPFPRNSLYREQEAAFFLRFRAATHHFPQNSLYRERDTAVLPRFRAATHHFKRKN